MADSKISALTDGSPAQAGDDLPVSRTDNVATRKVNAQSVADLKTWANLAGKPSVFPPDTHVTQHQNGGSDEIDLTGLSGVLADPQTPAAHTHPEGDITPVTASKLLGRGSAAGDGAAQEIAIGTGLAMTGTTLEATGSGSGAPTNAEYLVAAAHADLSAERVATNTPTVTWDFATAAQAKANVPDAAITNAKLANMANGTIKGRATAGAGVPEDLTATQINAILGFQKGFVSGSDIIVNNSTVLVNATGLAITIAAGETWYFEVSLLLSAGGIGSDFKFGWTGPASFTMNWLPGRDFVDVGVSGTPAAVLIASDTAIIGSRSGTFTGILRGWVSSPTNAGTVQLQFAQNTATAHDSSVKISSVLLARKVS